MNTAQNQRHMETERKLREALLFYMERDMEPTVDQICRQQGSTALPFTGIMQVYTI